VVKVDLQARRIEVGVRALIASGTPGRQRGPGMSGLRAHLGQQVHSRYDTERGEALGERFSAERPIKLVLEVDGFEATIGGRIDGMIGDESTLELEEVKSEFEGGGTDLATARLQVATYALALSRAGETRAMTLRVVLIDVDTQAERHVPVVFDPVATEARLAELLRGAIARAEVARQTADARALWAQRMVFPHDTVREGQAMLLDAAAECLESGQPLLAQAPTGTGKTAAALFGALSFAAQRGARVYYATPKTTQQAHVASTFEALCASTTSESDDDGSTAAPPFAVTLHARARLCRIGGTPCDRRSCPRLHHYTERAPAALVTLARNHRHVGDTELMSAAKEHNLCPYEMAFDLAETADLVIGDFNYVFDANIAILSRTSTKTVVVIDEAHNLLDRAREYASARITILDVQSAEEAIAPTDPVAVQALAWTADVRETLTNAAKAAAAAETNADLLEHDGVFELATLPWEIDGLAERARPLMLRWLSTPREAATPNAADVDPVTALLRSVVQMSDAGTLLTDTLVPYAIGARLRSGPGLGLVCVDPAKALTVRHREALGIIAMSATMTPLDYWNDVLGLEGLDAITLTVPSPFSPDQRKVVIDPSVSTVYRDRQESIPRVAEAIASVVALRPGPYLVFFPSFAYLRSVRPQIPALGEILAQAPRSSLADRRALLDRFRNGEGPRVLLAVAGGVFAEGIDLPGDALIGAMVVGPCLPPISFGRAVMARHFEATRQAGFAYAMLYPGLQRVVQAAGRVIRHEDDKGVVVLLGRRFMQPELVSCLPEDWYRYDPEELVPSDPLAALAAFWE